MAEEETTEEQPKKKSPILLIIKNKMEKTKNRQIEKIMKLLSRIVREIHYFLELKSVQNILSSLHTS